MRLSSCHSFPQTSFKLAMLPKILDWGTCSLWDALSCPLLANWQYFQMPQCMSADFANDATADQGCMRHCNLCCASTLLVLPGLAYVAESDLANHVAAEQGYMRHCSLDCASSLVVLPGLTYIAESDLARHVTADQGCMRHCSPRSGVPAVWCQQSSGRLCLGRSTGDGPDPPLSAPAGDLPPPRPNPVLVPHASGAICSQNHLSHMVCEQRCSAKAVAWLACLWDHCLCCRTIP